ncbi:MAG: threo-3-hydroxy-L-aspartate ammonia-lyase [Desulfobacterales bacterium]|jgi:threonine dehydratase|nr:threo-3-hydroxy-L-aspartate ammonia-lyase [Desulfobacterales bacterium]
MSKNTDNMFEFVQAASKRLRGHAHITPIMSSRTLNQSAGAEVYLKCENFQRVGAFKFRGAYNAMSQLSDKDAKRGVITHSSGNHAQAIALVGRLLGIQTTIVMPDDAPTTKRAATEAYGARIVEYNPLENTREKISEDLERKHGYILIPPYDHVDIVAGQGTAALELFEEIDSLDMLLVPCGGGGLLSGSAIAAKGAAPACQVIGIEPELADDATRSFKTGTLHTVENPPTIADGTRTPSLGEHVTFPFVLKYVDDMKTVSEAAIIKAVKFLFFRMKLVVEPSGALGVAALLSGVIQPQGRVGVIISGGNIDGDTMRKILGS